MFPKKLENVILMKLDHTSQSFFKKGTTTMQSLDKFRETLTQEDLLLRSCLTTTNAVLAYLYLEHNKVNNCKWITI